MKVNREKFNKLIEQRFNNNLHECAKALSVNVSTVSRVLSGNSNGGTKFFGNLMLYCNTNKLDFNSLIFLTEPLHKSNKIMNSA